MASFGKWISAAIGCVMLVAGPCANAQAPAAQQSPAAKSASTATATANTADNNYILGPGDVIEVSVLGTTYVGRGRIDADGNIQLQYLKDFKVSSLTPTQVADRVGKALAAAGIFVNPTTKVDIVSYASRYVIVAGAVAAPGLVPVDRAYRVSEILARVGSIRENAAEYVVVTPENGASKNLVIKDLMVGDSSKDPYVQAGDKIYVPIADIFYISGEVKSPSTFVLTPGITVNMAIARAGGLTDLGTNKGVKITRKGKTIDNVPLDERVQPDDIISIKQRLF